MFCSECGSKLKDGARFCENCGAKVPENVRAEQGKPEQTVSMFGGANTSDQPISMFGGAAADPLTGSMFGGFGASDPAAGNAEKKAETEGAEGFQGAVSAEMPGQPNKGAGPAPAAEKPVTKAGPSQGSEARSTFMPEFSQMPPRAPEPPPVSGGEAPSWAVFHGTEAEQGDNTQPQGTSATFPQAIKLYFSHFLDFEGRATRGEYWWAMLFNWLMQMGLQMIPFVGGVLGGIYSVSYLIGGISLTVRRLHDIGKQSISILFGLIPLVGPIILLVWCCQSSQGANAFGPSPWDDPNHFNEKA